MQFTPAPLHNLSISPQDSLDPPTAVMSPLSRNITPRHTGPIHLRTALDGHMIAFSMIFSLTSMLGHIYFNRTDDQHFIYNK